MKRHSQIYLIIIVIVLILISILAINIFFIDKSSGENAFSYIKEKLTNQDNSDNQENTNDETTDIPTTSAGGGGKSEGSSSGGGDSSGTPTSAKNCIYNQVSYSIGELNEYYFCNLEQEGVCVDKTAKCSVEVINFDETLGGTFGILFTLNEKENRDNIIQTQSASTYIEADNKKKLIIETTILGQEADKNISCSYTSTQIPQHEICS